jgi:hypothetical protein
MSDVESIDERIVSSPKIDYNERVSKKYPYKRESTSLISSKEYTPKELADIHR